MPACPAHVWMRQPAQPSSCSPCLLQEIYCCLASTPHTSCACFTNAAHIHDTPAVHYASCLMYFMCSTYGMLKIRHAVSCTFTSLAIDSGCDCDCDCDCSPPRSHPTPPTCRTHAARTWAPHLHARCLLHCPNTQVRTLLLAHWHLTLIPCTMCTPCVGEALIEQPAHVRMPQPIPRAVPVCGAVAVLVVPAVVL
jgi:hypothetical protein